MIASFDINIAFNIYIALATIVTTVKVIVTIATIPHITSASAVCIIRSLYLFHADFGAAMIASFDCIIR